MILWRVSNAVDTIAADMYEGFVLMVVLLFFFLLALLQVLTTRLGGK
jgi:Cu/Ag efflux pump CusA